MYNNPESLFAAVKKAVGSELSIRRSNDRLMVQKDVTSSTDGAMGPSTGTICTSEDRIRLNLPTTTTS